MSEALGVVVRGWLICRDDDEVALVTEHRARHVELTRAEPGCLAFSITPTEDPRVWRVAEHFADEAAFAAHQARTRASEWGRVTAAVERRLHRDTADTGDCGDALR